MIKLQFKKFSKKKLFAIMACVCAICISVSTIVGLTVHPSADTDNKRVQMYELFARYPINYVLGPIDVKDTNGDGVITRADMNNKGHYTYKDDENHCVLDSSGKHVKGSDGDQISSKGCKLTNNIYGIPANQYFDVESYIYTESDGSSGRILYGWQPSIQASGDALAENGEIMSTGSLSESASPIGIHVVYSSNTNGTIKMFGTTQKYALIVPSDITQVGQGSGAFVYNNGGTLTSYYGNTSSNDITYQAASYTSGDYAAKFTDFASFITNSIGTSGEPYFWQPRERLAGVYFPEDSDLTTIVSGSSTAAAAESNNRTTIDDKGKSAFQGCDNLRFAILPSGVKTIGDYAFYKCSQILDVNIPASATGITGVNNGNGIGVSAFQDCSSILYLSLSSKLKGKIGANAFTGCSKLIRVDDDAEYGSSAFPDNKNSDVFVFGGEPQNDVDDCGRYGFIFKRTKSGNNETWTALSLAGETGENENTVYVFPDSIDFNEESNRRTGVRYDYLDSEGIHQFSKFTSGVSNITYDIADKFADNTWCQNVIIPKACTAIGEYAFRNSHLAYLETYATTVGAYAFSDTSGTRATQWYYFHAKLQSIASTSFNNFNGHLIFENYTLFKSYEDSKPTNFPSNTTTSKYHYLIPIVANIENVDHESVTFNYGDMEDRYFIDSDYDTYIASRTVAGGTTSAVTYTKKLSGYTFNFIKHANGSWELARGETTAQINAITGTADVPGVGTHANPTLPNMTRTVWYSSDKYTGNATNAAALYSSSATAAVNIYTKYVARPTNIADKTYDGVYNGKYTYGENYTLNGNSVTLNDENSLDFYDVLGLDSKQYVIKLDSYRYADGTTGTPDAAKVHDAGTYMFSITLNPAWGAWEPSYTGVNSEYFTATVTVERQKIDYSTEQIIREPFTVVNAADGSDLLGDKTVLYHYDGAYHLVKEENSTSEPESVTVTKSFLYYTGSDISIALKDEKSVGDKIMFGEAILTKEKVTYSKSDYYDASFNFSVKKIGDTEKSNYIFYYGAGNDSSNNIELADLGMRVINKQNNSFTLTKRWYIVEKSNMFSNKAGSEEPYAPIVREEGQSGDIYYGDEIIVRNPMLTYGVSAGNVTFEVYFTPTGASETARVNLTKAYESVDENSQLIPLILDYGTGDTAEPWRRLSYYINSSMPAGGYTISLHGAAVTVNETGESSSVTYNAINSEAKITVLEKPFDAGVLKDIHDTILGTAVAGAEREEKEYNRYINAYPVSGSDKKLHDNILTEDLIGALISALNTKEDRLGYWAEDVATGYFAVKDLDDYTKSGVQVTYNRDGSGNTGYYDESSTLGGLANAGTYIFYYSISAKNFVTVGGEGASDRQDYGFRTTLYTALSMKEQIFDYINSMSEPYFKSVKYTGQDAHTLVPTNKYYSYEFDASNNNYIEGDSGPKRGYVDVGWVTVTLTLYDPNLVRWIVDLPEGADQYFKSFGNDDDGNPIYIDLKTGTIIVYYQIVPNDNGYTVAPSLTPWRYSSFDKNANTVTYGLNFDGAQVYFRLGTLSNGNYTWINLNGISLGAELDEGVSGAWFTVDDEFKIIDTTGKIIETLNNLPVLASGQYYYLGSYVAERADGNVKAFTPEAKIYSRVSVWEASNVWNVKPNMSGWKYYDFTTDYFLPGDAKFGGQAAVRYTLYAYNIQTKKYDIELLEFAYDSSNILTNDAVETFKELPASDYQYRISVYVAGNGLNYGELTETLSFSVSQTKNAWESGKTPNISSWVYNEFVKMDGTTFSSGSALFGSPVYVVQKVNETDDSIGDTVWTFDVSKDGTLETLLEKFAGLDAGRYNLYAYVEGNSNYLTVEQNVRFRVNKASNGWDISPSIKGWVYKEYVQATHNPMNASSKVETGDITYEYYPATMANGEWAKDGAAISLADLPNVSAGNYIMIATIPGNTNYEALSLIVPFTVEKQTNEWIGNGPEGILDWAWGATDKVDASDLIKVIALDVSNGIKYYIEKTNDSGDNHTVTVRFTKDQDGSFVRNADDAKNLLNTLKSLAAGSYKITVTVIETTNYRELNAVTNTTVDYAEFKWAENQEPHDIEWEWGWEMDKKQDVLAKLFADALNVKGNSIQLSFTVLKPGEVTASTIYYSLKDLKNFLVQGEYGQNAGVYTITVKAVEGKGLTDGNNDTYDTANYNKFEQEFTVTIRQSANGWDKSPAGEYEWEATASDKANKVPTAEAIYGEVVFYSNEALTVVYAADYAAFKDKVLALGAQEDNLIIYAAVKATVNYTATPTAKITLVITGTKSNWANESSLLPADENGEHILTFTYNSGIYSQVEDKIYDEAEDVYSYIPVGNNKTGTTSYSLSFTSYELGGDTVKEPAVTRSEAAAVLSWILNRIRSEEAVAGTYTIRATYVPEDPNYTTLKYVLTIIIERAKPQWDKTLQETYSGSYGNLDVPNPTVMGYNAPILITIESNIDNKVIYNSSENSKAFDEYVWELDAQTGINVFYIVRYKVAETYNYEGLDEKQSRLYISSLVNTWKEYTDDEGGLTITSNMWVKGYTWNFTREDVKANDGRLARTVVVPEATIGKVIITLNGSEYTEQALRDYLRLNLDAGTYELVFTVEGTNNYNGLSSICYIIISKLDVEWKQEFAFKETTVSGQVNSAEGSFQYPLVEDTGNKGFNASVRYYITKEGSTNQYGPYDLTKFKEELAKLRNGTYNITARLGGDLNDWVWFNQDYNSIETSCKITINPHSNAWDSDNGLVFGDWEYGATEEALKKIWKAPLATHGSENVEYTVAVTSSGDSTSKTLYSYEALIDYLLTLNAGEYSITALLTATDLYEAPGAPIVGTFKVLKMTTEWASGTNNGASFEWEYGKGTPTTWKEPQIKSGYVDWGNNKTYYIMMPNGENKPFDNWASMMSELANYTALSDGSSATYIVKVEVAEGVNHAALTYSVTVTISVLDNEWDKTTTGWNESWKESGVTDVKVSWIYGVGNTEIILLPLYNAENMTITVNGSTFEGSLMDYLKNQPASGAAYGIVATVPANDKYGSLSLTIMLTISKAENGWVEDKEGNIPLPQDSFVVGGQKPENNTWEYQSGATWLGVKSKQGNDVSIRITNSAGATIDAFVYNPTDNAAFESAKKRLNEFIATLDVGEYTMIISVKSSDSWEGLEDTTIHFTIIQTDNEWKDNREPAFKNATVKENNYEWIHGSYEWIFGNDTVSFDAASKFGVYDIEYYYFADYAASLTSGINTRSTPVPLGDMPTNAGEYVAVVKVDGTPNYRAIDKIVLAFTIKKALNNSFDRQPGITGWNWNGYDIVANLFMGRPNSGGIVSFEILNSGISAFNLVDGEGNVNANADENIYVSSEVAAKLKKLKAGTYTLRVHVAETTNYTGFYYDLTTPLVIGMAENGWIEIPQIFTWSSGQYVENTNMPKGEARYGTMTITITSDVMMPSDNLGDAPQEAIFYRAVYLFDNNTGYTYDENGKLVHSKESYINRLNAADVGLYTMWIDVDGAEHMYNDMHESIQFEIYIQGSYDKNNFWVSNPSIADWVADIIDGEGYYELPTGIAARGKPYFAFYEAEKVGNTWRITDKKVDANTPGAVLIDVTKAEYNKFGKSFYIPTAPGTYYVCGLVFNESYEGDNMDEDSATAWRFTISDRLIDWEQSVKIDPVLYLGERSENSNWGAYSSRVNIVNDPSVRYEYKFFNADTDEYIGTTVPVKVGNYYIVAYAWADYTKVLESKMTFEVKLSTNRWLYGTSPSIENWSEENNGNSPDPVGWAYRGEIVYTYANLAHPDVILTEKPTTAGKYIMYATVEYEGYETLTAEYEFIIEPAFDTTLLLIDIVLATFACILTVVVIFFAIRRYREN